MQATCDRVEKDDRGRPDDEMMSLAAVLAFFGGDRPIHYSTLYRGIKDNRYPKGVPVGPNSVRWLRSECRAARQKLIDASREGEPEAA